MATATKTNKTKFCIVRSGEREPWRLIFLILISNLTPRSRFSFEIVWTIRKQASPTRLVNFAVIMPNPLHLFHGNKYIFKFARNIREIKQPGALSIWMEKSVFPVGNQMEQAFQLEIFRKKGNTFRGIPLFSFSPELPENHCTIYFITPVPCSLVKLRDFAPENGVLLHVSVSNIRLNAFMGHSCSTSGER